MKFQSEPTVIRHQIGHCPACRSGLWATVALHVECGTPQMTPDGKATVSARPVFDGMSIEHACERDEDGMLVERQKPTTPDLEDVARSIEAMATASQYGPHRRAGMQDAAARVRRIAVEESLRATETEETP